jgi:hypothetical protein
MMSAKVRNYLTVISLIWIGLATLGFLAGASSGTAPSPEEMEARLQAGEQVIRQVDPQGILYSYCQPDNQGYIWVVCTPAWALADPAERQRVDRYVRSLWENQTGRALICFADAPGTTYD